MGNDFLSGFDFLSFCLLMDMNMNVKCVWVVVVGCVFVCFYCCLHFTHPQLLHCVFYPYVSFWEYILNFCQITVLPLAMKRCPNSSHHMTYVSCDIREYVTNFLFLVLEHPYGRIYVYVIWFYNLKISIFHK